MRAQRGGFVRWHILSTEQQIISSTYWELYWEGCMDVFSISVGLEERDSGVMPIALENTQLCMLVRDLGSDLEQLQKLKRSQVVDIYYGLENASFVLEQKRIQKVLEAEGHFLMKDPCGMLQPRWVGGTKICCLTCTHLDFQSSGKVYREL
ncbi:uncharacterized protein ASPGLDRAFT_405649 [Aspergillus glaucus CBS 516.65]|uniref:Uncharacterized protein n=1 Tax=Aspergillus glaucus CBS 516.65 TaxID=1160497 RepID=A0A1L9VHS2_ASPGL|nr:hypothetical protein ASPGLDRAFT_405649 [Aspergillus glaucus CBS 516.65]OJJ83478.1 hypothetical protein ASPGLDRAFT_405649 [Aspergillus glaucus CBS 516.65]